MIYHENQLSSHINASPVGSAGSGCLRSKRSYQLRSPSGLSNGFVRSITQDANGFIWVATEDGLNRFDGQKFVPFTTSNSGLAANELNFVTPDPTDSLRLWVATQRSGLQTLDLITGEILDSTLPDLMSKEVMRVDRASGGEGGFWVTHYHFGIQYYDKDLKHTRTYGKTNLPGMSYRCWTMADPGNGNIYIGHDMGGFSVVDTLSRSFVNYRHDPADPGSLCGESVYAMLIDSGGNVWLGTDQGVSLFNPVNESFTNFIYDESDPGSIGPGRVYDICRMNNGEIWFSTSEGGISILDSKVYAYTDISSAKFRRLPHDGSINGTSSNNARCIFQDSFDNIWIGNYRNGVDVKHHLNPLFRRVNFSAPASPVSDSGCFWSCFEDKDGNLWFGGDGKIIKFTGGSDETFYLPRDPHHVSNEVKSIGMDSDGNLWLAVKERGVMVLTPSYKFIKSNISDPEPRVIFPDSSGRILAGASMESILRRLPQTAL